MKLRDILSEEEKNWRDNDLARPLPPNYKSGDLFYNFKDIKSLEGFPPHIFADLNVSHNKLTTLKGAPSIVDGNFNCSSNLLESLEYIPKIGGHFHCADNHIKSLSGCQEIIHDECRINGNLLKSLEGAPSEIHGDFYCHENHLTSLKNIHKIIKRIDGSFFATDNPIASHVLGILLIEGCTKVFLGEVNTPKTYKVDKILNKYLPNKEGMKGLLKCQEELFAADLDEYAQL